MAAKTPEALPVVIKNPQFKAWEKVAYPLASRFVGRRVEGLTDVWEYPGAKDEFAKRFKGGAFGVVAQGPHLAHHDPVGAMGDMRDLKRKSDASGYLLPVSVTLINGRQVEANKLYKLLVPYMEWNSVSLLPVATPNDYRRLMEGHPKPDEVKRNLDAINAAATERMLNSRKERQIIFVLPEGSLQAGREKTDGSLHGMQRVKMLTLGKILGKNVDPKGKHSDDFAVLPIGIWGTEKVYDPSKYKISEEVMQELKRLPWINQRRTFSHLRIGQVLGKTEYRSYLETSGRLSVGASDKQLAQFMKENPDVFFDYLMGENIARMIPPEYRGDYSQIRETILV